MKFGIAMPYWNRKRQIGNTLAEINKYIDTSSDSVFISIMDDGSDDDEKLDDEFLSQFNNITINYIYLPKEKKAHVNPSFTFQLAIDVVRKIRDVDVLILQSPEVCWKGDIFKYISEHYHENTYYVFSCYETYNWDWSPSVSLDETIGGEGTWLQHSQHSNRQFHFCTAMNLKRWETIGYFDPRMYDGYWYDDDLLIWKIRRAGVNVMSVDNPMTIHQRHNRSWENRLDLIRKNLQVLQAIMSGRI